MEGQIDVTYTIICDNDINLELPIAEVLSNEKVQSLIRKEFAGNARGVVIDHTKVSGTLIVEKERPCYSVIIDKNDYADALTLAEEDAKKRKLLKAGCSMVELLDLQTVGESKEK